MSFARTPALATALLLGLTATTLAPRPALATEAPRTALLTLTSAQAQQLAQAEQAFRQHHYAAAYGRFAQLANEGHAPSARIALLMVEHGPALFGTAWSASVPEQLRWRALTINQARAQPGAADTLRGE